MIMKRSKVSLIRPIHKAMISVILMGMILAFGLSQFVPWVANGDLIAYWTSARLLATGGNPYDAEEIALLQVAQRPELAFDESISFIPSWNPPQLTILLIPLGLLAYNVAVYFWIFINVICIGFSIILCWNKFTKPFDERGFLIIFLICMTLFPTLLLIILGQITGLLLLFMMLCLYCVENRYDFFAGFFLMMMTVKPHLFYFVVILILIWAVRQRRWRIIIGMILTGLVVLLVMWVILPGWIGEYFNLLSYLSGSNESKGTFGSFMDITFGTSVFNYIALLLLPLVPAFIRLAEREGWMNTTNIALPLSLPLSPYGFGADQVLVYPTIVQIFAWIRKKEMSDRVITILVIGFFFINIGCTFLLLQRSKYYSDFWFPWFILMLFIIVKKLRRSTY